MGEGIEAFPPEETVADIDLLVAGLVEKIDSQKDEVTPQGRLFDKAASEAMDNCIGRAADTYLEQATDLISTWRSLNVAQLKRGDRGAGVDSTAHPRP